MKLIEEYGGLIGAVIGCSLILKVFFSFISEYGNIVTICFKGFMG